MAIMGQLSPMSAMAAAAIKAMFFLSITFQYVSATNHTVGGPTGWDLASDMKTWASKTLFITGDNLVFVYKLEHDVIEVGERDYGQCHIQSPIHTYGGGNAVIPLTKPGTRYFSCSKPSHCFQGLKIQIDVLLSASPINETGSGATAPIGSDDQVKSPDAITELSRRHGPLLSPRRYSLPPPPLQGFGPPTPPWYEYPPTEFPPTEFPRSLSHNGNGALTVKNKFSYLVHYWYVLVLLLAGVPGSMFLFFRGRCICMCEACGGCITSQDAEAILNT